MGRQSTKKGDQGEHLFGYLLKDWDADFVHTTEAKGTDGYIEWADLHGVRLWVQIKTVPRRSKSSKPFTVRIKKTSTLRAWSSYSPLLVYCILDEARAWWLDTFLSHSVWAFKRSHTFHVPFNQQINVKTKKEVRRIALQRPRSLLPYMSQISTISTQKPIDPKRIEKIIENAYKEMQNVGIIERDVNALAVARIIHTNIASVSSVSLDPFLDLVSSRLLSSEWGGRSFTLGALVALLNPRLSNQFDKKFIQTLLKTSENAINQKSFLNPEFGLLIVASLSQRFPEVRYLPEFLEHLINKVSSTPQNAIVDEVSIKLRGWLENQERPVQGIFNRGWIDEQIIRPLPQDSEVLAEPDKVEEMVFNALEYGVQGCTQEELFLTDQMIRWKAIRRLEKWRNDS